jgi:hypothetical protein
VNYTDSEPVNSSFYSSKNSNHFSLTQIFSSLIVQSETFISSMMVADANSMRADKATLQPINEKYSCWLDDFEREHAASLFTK